MGDLLGSFGSGGASATGPTSTSVPDILRNVPGVSAAQPDGGPLAAIQAFLKLINPSVKLGPGASGTPPPLTAAPTLPTGTGPALQSTAPAALARLAQINPTLSAGGRGGDDPRAALLRLLMGGR